MPVALFVVVAVKVGIAELQEARVVSSSSQPD